MSALPHSAGWPQQHQQQPGHRPLDEVLNGLKDMGGRILASSPSAIGDQVQWWLLESRLIAVVIYDRASGSFEVFTSCGRDDVAEIKRSLEACFAADASHGPKPERPAVIVPEKPKSRARKPPLFADASST